MHGIATIVLAAGSSTRLGRPKQSVMFRGETLLRHAVRTALASAQDDPVIVVLGAKAPKFQNSLEDLPIHTITNPQWALGMGSSIRTGLKYLAGLGGCEAVLIMTCDQPMVTVRLLDTLKRDFHLSVAGIAASLYGSTIGIPAMFAKEHFHELVKLPDNQGAKQIILKNLEMAAIIPFPEGIIDIDTEADLAGLSDSSKFKNSTAQPRTSLRRAS